VGRTTFTGGAARGAIAAGSRFGVAGLSRDGSGAGFDVLPAIAMLTVPGFCCSLKSSGPVSTTGTGVTEDDELHCTVGRGGTTLEAAAADRSDSGLVESAKVACTAYGRLSDRDLSQTNRPATQTIAATTIAFEDRFRSQYVICVK
jgi:hypothetical protein